MIADQIMRALSVGKLANDVEDSEIKCQNYMNNNDMFCAV